MIFQYQFKRKVPHLTQPLIFAHAFQWGRGTLITDEFRMSLLNFK